MCGFVGALRTSELSPPLSDDLMMELASVLVHRGPDARGLYRDQHCALAHHRLSILDLSDAGTQPMGSRDGERWIAYNGEIYNFRELRARFGLDKRHDFRSKTDTEVVLYLYEELGTDFLSELDGMFSLAIWDARQRVVHLARDPMGVKPLFHATTRSGFWFASELKALMQIPDLERRPSLAALHHYLSFNFVPGSLTAFDGVHELRPGCLLTIGVGDPNPKISRFRSHSFHPDRSRSFQHDRSRAGELLQEAVERQLISDVPVGVMLSGGKDSSAIAAMMARARGDARFDTFSLAFDEPSYDESRYSRMMAEHLGTRHHEIRVTPDAVRQNLTRCTAHIDEPYADGSAIPTLLLADRAYDIVRVLLSGEGGDEVFTGYDTHAAYDARRLYRYLPRALRQRLIRPVVACLPASDKKLSFEFKAKRFVAGAELGVPESHFFWRAVLSEDAKREVLSAPPTGPRSDSLFVQAYEECNAEEELSRLQYVDLSFHLPDDLMVKNDRMTMARSIEARVPFTDSALVDFLSTVPARHKMRLLRPKALLPGILEGLVPAPVLRKPKVGLEMPYSIWLRRELRDVAEELLSRQRVDATGLLSGRAVERLLVEHVSRRADHGRVLWGLINYMLWLDLFIRTTDFSLHLTTPTAPLRPWRRFGPAELPGSVA